MKKVLLGVFVLVFLLTSAGCAAPPAAAPTPEKIRETVVVTQIVNNPATPVPAAVEPEPAKLLGPVTLEYSGWNYDVAKVTDIIARFEPWVKTQAVPPVDVKIEWTDAGYGEFDTFVTSTYAGGSTRDVLYSSDHWLAKWAEAGWVVPLEDYWPDVKKYVSDISPFSVEAMTYKGKLYGLPYYSDAMYFVYNQKMLDSAGIATPPTTWAEVREQAMLMKQKGISQTPFLVGLAPGSWFDEAFYAMIYSEGAQMFDANLEPVFETDKGPVFDMVEWLAKAINDDQIIPKKVLEMAAPDVQQAFKNGDAAFVIVPGYMMAEFNTPGISKVAGFAKISMMPGATHKTDGFTRMYLLGSGAVKDDVKKQAAIHLIEYLGGKTTVDGVTDFQVSKRWSIENGLGFSVLSLWSDPAIERRFSAMADTNVMQAQKKLTLSKQGMSAPWFAEWISFVRAETQKALLRDQTTTDTLDGMKKQWTDLKAE